MNIYLSDQKNFMATHLARLYTLQVIKYEASQLKEKTNSIKVIAPKQLSGINGFFI